MRVFGAILCLVLGATAVPAATLTQGNNALSGTTAAERPTLAGTVVEDDLVPFVFTTDAGSLTGTVQNRVVHSIDQTYDFYWRITVNSFTGTEPFDIQEFRIGSFGIDLVGTYGDYRPDGPGEVAPGSAFVFPAPYQNYVNFLFGDGLTAGQSSYAMFLDTDATSYGRTAFYDFGREGSTQISGQYESFGPPPAVPEPASWSLMLLGFGAVGSAMRRRSRAGSPHTDARHPTVADFGALGGALGSQGQRRRTLARRVER